MKYPAIQRMDGREDEIRRKTIEFQEHKRNRAKRIKSARHTARANFNYSDGWTNRLMAELNGK
nr:MAG TPA: hypothetical protein [Caudoviricetes sp.]